MISTYAGIVALLGVFLIFAIGFFVLSQSSAQGEAGKIKESVYRIRRVWFVFLVALLVGILATTLPHAPNLKAAETHPQVVVKVDGRMWAWTFTPVSGAQLGADCTLQVPAGKTVEFLVTASDVNHGFGVYDAAGTMLTQVQAMPGYVNRLVYTFRQPGTYTVLCLEYCGVGHQVMTSQFKVI